MGEIVDMEVACRGFEERLEALAKIRRLQEDYAPDGEMVEALEAALAIYTTGTDTR